jgi:hypothetical protein
VILAGHLSEPNGIIPLAALLIGFREKRTLARIGQGDQGEVMSLASAKVRRSLAPAQMTSQQVVEELEELIRDLHELLESYAPVWYTEDLDIRVTEMRAQLTLLKRPPQNLMKDEQGRL